MKSSVRRGIKLYATLLVFLPQSFGADVIVQRGDTLSQIFYRQYNQSLYRRPDWMAKIIQFNPQMNDPNFIFPGQVIHFEFTETELLSQFQAQTSSPIRDVASTVSEPSLPSLPATPVASDSVPFMPVETAAEKTLVSVENQKPCCGFGIKAGFEYFRIQSTDINTGIESVYLSTLSPQIHLKWDYNVDEWTYISQVNLMTYDLQNDIRNPNVVMERQKDSRYGFSLGAERLWASGQRSGFFLTYQERMFFHSITASRLSADRIGSAGLKLQHEVDLFQVRNAKGGFHLSAQAVSPGQGPGYSTKAGLGADLQFFFRYPTRHWTMDTALYYGLMNQDSDLVEQKESHLGVLWGVTWNFED